MTEIGLVGCASMKLKRPAQARDLYVSPLFRKASAHAAATCDRWYVLSAKHGLLRPDDVVEPYDVKLGRTTRDPATNAPTIHGWAQRVREQLRQELHGIPGAHLSILAGEQYRTIIYADFPWSHDVPMKGMGLGEQLAWLNAQAATRTKACPEDDR